MVLLMYESENNILSDESFNQYQLRHPGTKTGSMVDSVKALPLTQFTLCTIEQRINCEKIAICVRKLVKTEFYGVLRKTR